MRVGLALAALGFVAAACSSSPLQRDAGGQLPLDAAFADAAIPPGGFITGDVDGVTIRGDHVAVAYWFSGIVQGSIGVQAQNDEWQWVIIVANVVGSSPCAGGYIALQKVTNAAMAAGTYGPEGACAIDVTAAAPNVGDVLEGTFTATLDPVSTGAVKHVTNGSFHIPRVADMP